MSEERRASPVPKSNDVSVLTPEVGSVALVAPSTGAEGAPPQAEGHPARADASGARDLSPAARRRGRMTLRIPDDEVSRPRADSDPPGTVAHRPLTPSEPPASRRDSDAHHLHRFGAAACSRGGR